MSKPNEPSTPSPEHVELRRMLELELEKTRNEANAARLEARAIEIKLMMQQIDQSSDVDSPSDLASLNQNVSSENHDRSAIDSQATSHQAIHQPPGDAPSPTSFSSWDAIRSASADQEASTAIQTITRTDSAHSSVPRPYAAEVFAPSGSRSKNKDRNQQGDSSKRKDSGSRRDPSPATPRTDQPKSQKSVPVVPAPANVHTTKTAPAISSASMPTILTADSARRPQRVGAMDLAEQLSQTWESDEPLSPPTRRRPAAIIVSAVVHVVILLLLATIGFQVHRPKDQVSLSASSSEPDEVAVETFTVETTELETQPEEFTEPSPSEVEYEVSPVGNLPVTQFTPESITSATQLASSLSSDASSSAAKSLQSHSTSAAQFCGVDGGGNHFVYLVDSSGSMREGFASARQALFESIDLLTPDQRFYVVFFDAEPDFMRLTNPGEDEPRSVYATAENKAALRRWAVRVGQDRGRAPYEPLKFALGLKPDVIFLLSDGEFPEGIAKLLQEENQVENLFGDSGPISIVHTIGYFSKQGASIMKRIASQNNGQYRHVPKP